MKDDADRSPAASISAADAQPALTGVALGERPGRFDIAFQNGRIASIAPSLRSDAPAWLALPAFVNFHAHAGRSFVAPARRPGSLADAVASAQAERATASAAEVRARAGRFLERAAVHGTCRVRSHTDVDAVTGLRAVEGVLGAAADMKEAIDVDVVAFANASADPALPATRDLLAAAVSCGATLVGAVPAMYERPLVSAAALLDLGIDLGVAVDLHLDEHLDAGTAVIEQVVDAVLERRLNGRVTISHGCVLSVLDDRVVERIFEKMARLRITLCVQPALNLYLQDRGGSAPRRRGLPPVLQALRAGVDVRFGTDNVRDWFFPLGDADPLDEGYIGALGAHLDAPAPLIAAMCGGRSALAVGDLADLVLIPAASFDDALARRPSGRTLMRRGRIVRPNRTD